MARYRGGLGIEEDHRCHGVSWRDVYRLFESHLGETNNDVDGFLLEEFTDYLELMRMVPFRGFDREKLRGSGREKYRQSLMRGVDQKNTGSFSQMLYDNRGKYGFEDFLATSNKDSREVHLADEGALDDYTFSKLNHFSAGFWHAGNFSVQLYIRRRLISNLTDGGYGPHPEFVRGMKQGQGRPRSDDQTTRAGLIKRRRRGLPRGGKSYHRE